MKKFLRILFKGKGNRHVLLFLFDIVCYLAANLLFVLLADKGTVAGHFGAFAWNAGLQLAAVFLLRILLGVYSNVWRYPDAKAYLTAFFADLFGSVAAVGAAALLNLLYAGLYCGFRQAVTVGAAGCLLTLAARFLYSLLYDNWAREDRRGEKAPVVIVGAGAQGVNLATELKKNPDAKYIPHFFVDTDPSKIGNTAAGLKIVSREEAETAIPLLKIREVVIAVPDLDGEKRDELYQFYRKLGCRVQMYEAADEGTYLRRGRLREFTIEDLLSRAPVEMDAHPAFYRGKTVLVTGGGGSIGSELCRRLSGCGLGRLVIFDIYENNAYDIQQELLETCGRDFPVSVEIGSVRDRARLEEIFAKYRPQIVFHAAAHKHVPLMEHSCAEAIKNNVFGTENTADMAEKYGTEHFILISTDKAVNPTNVMGASKRMCEMLIQSRADSATCFSAVRFGNVLGSNGSVIPLFRRQIAEGGPVTLTDKRVVRYFMTIPEAARLVMQAGAMAKRGELFVLDMGKPVKIYDLAVNMIELSGLEPGRDIEIREIGLRPGEKLYEELLMKSETLTKTENELIFVEKDRPYSREEVAEKLAVLTEALRPGGDVRAAMGRVVPTYRDAEVVNREAENLCGSHSLADGV